jgi:hypothetical protein
LPFVNDVDEKRQQCYITDRVGGYIDLPRFFEDLKITSQLQWQIKKMLFKALLEKAIRTHDQSQQIVPRHLKKSLQKGGDATHE